MRVSRSKKPSRTAAPRATRATRTKVNYAQSSSGSQSGKSSYESDRGVNNAAAAMRGLKIDEKFNVNGFFDHVKSLKNENEIHGFVKATLKGSPERLSKIARSETMRGILERNSPNQNQRYAAEFVIREAFDDKEVREHIKKEYANTPGLKENPAAFGLRRAVREGKVIFSRTPGRYA